MVSDTLQIIVGIDKEFTCHHLYKHALDTLTENKENKTEKNKRKQTLKFGAFADW